MQDFMKVLKIREYIIHEPSHQLHLATYCLYSVLKFSALKYLLHLEFLQGLGKFKSLPTMGSVLLIIMVIKNWLEGKGDSHVAK